MISRTASAFVEAVWRKKLKSRLDYHNKLVVFLSSSVVYMFETVWTLKNINLPSSHFIPQEIIASVIF